MLYPLAACIYSKSLYDCEFLTQRISRRQRRQERERRIQRERAAPQPPVQPVGDQQEPQVEMVEQPRPEQNPEQQAHPNQPVWGISLSSILNNEMEEEALSSSNDSESYGSERRYMREIVRQQLREMEEEKVPESEVDEAP